MLKRDHDRGSARLGGAAALVGLVLLAALVAAQEPPGRIVVDPDILVSRDGDIPHVETVLAASPREPEILLGAAIADQDGVGGPACHVFVSRDGGGSWRTITFAEQQKWGGVDPQVAFAPDGTALFVALDNEPDPETGYEAGALRVYRSPDGGLTWEPPVNLGPWYDHPQLAVDLTDSAHSGNVYISVLHGGDYRISLFRSADGGRTFAVPVTVAVGKETGHGHQSLPPVVLGDGALLVPFVAWPHADGKHSFETMTPALVLSTDGGATFGEQRQMPQMVGTEAELGRFATPGQVAADAFSQRFRDRVYVVWTDFGGARPRILLASSDDRGATWCEPIRVDPNAPDAALQYQPALAVRADGVVGVSWFDTREAQGGAANQVYFSASLDGGTSFLPPRRVSSQPSVARSAGNLRFRFLSWRPGRDKPLRITALAFANRWEHGGEYVGLAVSADGVFRPFWPDSRSGTFQVYTAAVRVTEDEPEMPPAKLRRVAVGEWVRLMSDPSTFDPETQVLAIPVRLVNRGEATLLPPLEVEVVGFGSGRGEMYRHLAPELLNADNAKKGVGATFDFSAALGDRSVLAAGGHTCARVWRLRLADSRQVPDLHVRIWGYLAE